MKAMKDDTVFKEKPIPEQIEYHTSRARIIEMYVKQGRKCFESICEIDMRGAHDCLIVNCDDHDVVDGIKLDIINRMDAKRIWHLAQVKKLATQIDLNNET